MRTFSRTILLWLARRCLTLTGRLFRRGLGVEEVRVEATWWEQEPSSKFGYTTSTSDPTEWQWPDIHVWH